MHNSVSLHSTSSDGIADGYYYNLHLDDNSLSFGDKTILLDQIAELDLRIGRIDYSNKLFISAIALIFIGLFLLKSIGLIMIAIGIYIIYSSTKREKRFCTLSITTSSSNSSNFNFTYSDYDTAKEFKQSVLNAINANK